MVSQIIRYRAEDGTTFPTLDAANAYEALAERITKALEPLGKSLDDIDYTNGRGYIHHNSRSVEKAKAALIEVSHDVIGWWTKDQQDKGVDLMEVHSSYFLRMIDGGNPALERAWSRLYRIDTQGREWGQSYYATHPEKGDQVCIEDRR